MKGMFDIAKWYISLDRYQMNIKREMIYIYIYIYDVIEAMLTCSKLYILFTIYGKIKEVK
tara:strand:- start:155 stop:334 length:180 start_codon:yes stop_codon:yes gene_type:complete